MTVRHAYSLKALDSEYKQIGGMIYVREDQWIGLKPQSNNFDFAKNEKVESFVWRGMTFYYIGSFTGEFFHVIGNVSEKEYEQKFFKNRGSLFEMFTSSCKVYTLSRNDL